MSQTNFEGQKIDLMGQFPKVGQHAHDFELVGTDLKLITNEMFLGKKVVLNIFPSVDTPVCADVCMTFEEKLIDRDDVEALCISADTPFAADRFAELNNIKKMRFASTFRNLSFGEDFGVEIGEGPLLQLCARAVLVLDEKGVIIYAELVDDIVFTPNYDAVMMALK